MSKLPLALMSAVLTSCATLPPSGQASASAAPAPAPHSAKTSRDPFSSTYQAAASPATLIRGATVLTGTGTRLDGGDVLIVNGRIEAVGKDLHAPEGATVIDAAGRWVTPGIIDIHSHLGVYPSPGLKGLQDGNELTNPVTANVWAEHSIWPQDPGFETALEGGVTTLEILPGSGNLIGGRSVVVKNVHATTYQAMKFPGAQQGLKMACGENPKRVYGSKGQAPSTLMGDVAGYRQAFADAQDYKRQWEKYDREQAEYQKKKDGAGSDGGDKKATPPSPPKRDLKLDTLADVLKGDIRVQMHCYRGDQMATMLDVADEFGFKIVAFHHAVEAYKVADLLASKGVCAAMWADWWGFKVEAYDGIQENIAIVDAPAGSCAMLHSDSEDGIQRLNQEAAKAMSRGVRAGLDIPPERAIRWLTINPAKALGLDDRIGALEPGKNADVVIWNRNPFSVYALADEVFIDGTVAFNRAHPPQKPPSDFMLGQPNAEELP
jgi:imidazolonepropionase-like amidohydrolase